MTNNPNDGRPLYAESFAAEIDGPHPAWAKVHITAGLLALATALLESCKAHSLSRARRWIANVTWSPAKADGGELIQLEDDEIEVTAEGIIRLLAKVKHGSYTITTYPFTLDQLRAWAREDDTSPVFVGEPPENGIPRDLFGAASVPAAEAVLIPEQEFTSDWGAHGPHEGGMYDHQDVVDKPRNTVWTILEGESNRLYAAAGFHVVNRIGYVLTTRPWVTGEEEALWCEGVDEEPADDDEETVLTDLTAWPATGIAHLFALPAQPIRFGDFEDAVRKLERPYIRITEAHAEVLSGLTAGVGTDVVLFRGRPVTWGTADGGYALMPLSAAARRELGL